MSAYVRLQAAITKQIDDYLTLDRITQIMINKQIANLNSVEAINQITNQCIWQLTPLIEQDLKNKNLSFTARNFLTLLLSRIPQKLQEIALALNQI
jgi:hypothetical protein